ncbi:MAG TPA: selenide, water dikinase SelD [Stellaceae bacterium]|nr:selenide, water dikinase SelD [Stellaceae bacterium]
MMIPQEVRTDIVLVGGGHAHVHVLTAFAMQPAPGVRLTLVTRDLETPYSGMLPGVIAGLYERQEAHIDLLRLAAATGTRLIHAEAVGLDRAAKRLELAGRPPIAYDILSLDVGIAPALGGIAGAAGHAIAVKPIGSFLEKFAAFRERCRAAAGPQRVAVIGGGAGGAELLLSMRSRLLAEAREPARLSFALVTAEEILPTHNTRVRRAFRRVFAERGIALYEHRRAIEVRPDAIVTEGGEPILADAVFITTQAAAPAWLATTGLALAPGGFVAVGATLQAVNDPDVFAAGDCATLTHAPREKAGVYAVRAGPPLAESLRRRALGIEPKAWTPQRAHLALVSTGERYAIASRGALKAEGAWLWMLKDWIDRRWMRMYQDADAISVRMASRPQSALPASQSAAEMRCGGCAAKVGPGPLSRALKRLPPGEAGEVVVGLDRPDDAAVLVPPAGRHLVETVDFFRAFIDDPYLFGEIAANHALNDVFAMGGSPRHALAIAVVPAAAPEKTEEALFQLLAGARACLDREGVALVGGHSSEGPELALGFSVSGEVDPAHILRKGGLGAGDALILTKPLGTGILFAAAMRARAPAAAIEQALASMRRSNRDAAKILMAHGASAMTDVSGFGLIGHLSEMLSASGADATLDAAAIPAYPQALELARAGIASTLLSENLALAYLLRGAEDAATHALLFDPQTSGGMLAGVPAGKARACVAELAAAGHGAAAIIGRVGRTGLAAADVLISLSS